ncbi:MAG: aminotransferase class I/II-fold pyridoxal phosphate-dependent enzyme [Candidatus Latescibacteria bacterium]|nr:aminotransferase class I/II-fold pyridoxal phosphate-dependent enzyme [Candidatus Latescibacterota bacterium]NIM21087.1 aminotransferase class I/II-fold pyridoxal phosphate-dependent enzyme [Candidatus Latescibacterota bacterium]NIM65222.1 aminotransferase class I/II-fold pyridoxal phosphate-dependent enzyme [Candidatus Latescibacterota bacterium]NIO01737.1 aminotransferase class I/II-fold pyridoxal phosphate-dependent enzyme [Candidatus Latescibacterota bacterium]NIO28254.1 aminotransferase
MQKHKPALDGGTPVRDTFLPFYRAPIDDEDIECVAETLRSGWLTVGPKTEEFEAAIESYLGVKHAIVLSSCSEAMFLALKALGVGPGDEVITSALTFASTVHAIIHTGAIPVLTDIEEETFGPSPAEIKKRITHRTKAIMPVHFGGQACRIDDICAIADEKSLAVVEDAAHGFGAAYKGVKVGAFGDATAFSFYATKNLTTGEGGCLTVQDERFESKLRCLLYHGMSRDSWERYTDRGSWSYKVEVPGYKCNLNDILSSLGLSQLRKVDKQLERRAEVAHKYMMHLQTSPIFELPKVRDGNLHTWHLFVVRLNLEKLTVDRDHFTKALAAENIGCSVHFIPVYVHPFFVPYKSSNDRFPACEDYFSRCISLPIYPGMEDGDVQDVVEALNKVASYYTKL